jgi:hypothetical protein
MEYSLSNKVKGGKHWVEGEVKIEFTVLQSQ